MPPIKVLHLILTLSGGGAQRQLVNLVLSTSREKVDHVVCVMYDAEFFAPVLRDASYKVIDLGIVGNRPFFTTARKFRRVIKEEQPDIIHTWLYYANVGARLAAFPSRRIPIITSLQLPDYDPEAARLGNWNPKKVWALKTIDKGTALFSKPHFVACSEFVKRSYMRNYGLKNEHSSVIFNAVDKTGLSGSATSAAVLRREFSIPDDGFIFLNVGRLDPQKNHEVLIDAFRLAANDAPNAYLLLAGTGGLESELKDLVRDLGLEKRIRFLGQRGDIGELLMLADVFIFPSLFEGLGVALVEAMFYSLACIASRIPVLEEVIEDGVSGLLIDPNSVQELCNAMTRLYKDEGLRKALGTRAYIEADEKFDASKTARLWEDLYQRIAAPR